MIIIINLKFLLYKEKAFELLHRNNIDIVASLKKLPHTIHLLESLKLDCIYFQPNMITFTVSGVLKEETKLAEEISSCFRIFQRAFVCIPTSNEQ